jgi:hypothetical protein
VRPPLGAGGASDARSRASVLPATPSNAHQRKPCAPQLQRSRTERLVLGPAQVARPGRQRHDDEHGRVAVGAAHFDESGHGARRRGSDARPRRPVRHRPNSARPPLSNLNKRDARTRSSAGS